MAGHDLVQPWVHPTVSGIRSICLDVPSVGAQRICNNLYCNFWRSGAVDTKSFSTCATAIRPCGGGGFFLSGGGGILPLTFPLPREFFCFFGGVFLCVPASCLGGGGVPLSP